MCAWVGKALGLRLEENYPPRGSSSRTLQLVSESRWVEGAGPETGGGEEGYLFLFGGPKLAGLRFLFPLTHLPSLWSHRMHTDDPWSW